jgi:hypothetical protein
LGTQRSIETVMSALEPRLPLNTKFYRDMIQRHGAASTLYYAAYRGVNRVARTTLWDALVITMDRLDPKILSDPKCSLVQEVNADALRRYVGEENTLSHEFIDAAAERHDRCFAVFEGEHLANYGWYATRPTDLVELGGNMLLKFDPAYVYMHNGFTAPKNRGQRLHAVSMAVALAAVCREGRKGLVSYVATSNFASLKSCERMGYQRVGRIGSVKLGDKVRAFATPGCKPFGLEVIQRPVQNPT